MSQLIKPRLVAGPELQCYHTSLQVIDDQSTPFTISLLAAEIYVVRVRIDQQVSIVIKHKQSDRVNIYGEMIVEDHHPFTVTAEALFYEAPQRFEVDFVTPTTITLTPFFDAMRPSLMVNIRIFPDYANVGPGSLELKATEGYSLAFIRVN